LACAFVIAGRSSSSSWIFARDDELSANGLFVGGMLLLVVVVVLLWRQAICLHSTHEN